MLAGGRGTRLRALTDFRAKPAVYFGGKYRIIDFTLSNCINSGFRRISVLTQYKAHSLLGHLQRGWSFLRGEFNEFIDLIPAQQRLDDESWYKGTTDAVRQNLDILTAHNPEYVLILAGDHIYKMDYAAMLSDHIAMRAEATVGCVEVPRAQATRLRLRRDRQRGPHRRLPGKAGRSAGHDRRAGPLARQHGHLHLRRQAAVRGAGARRRRRELHRTISART